MTTRNKVDILVVKLTLVLLARCNHYTKDCSTDDVRELNNASHWRMLHVSVLYAQHGRELWHLRIATFHMDLASRPMHYAFIFNPFIKMPCSEK
jgi:hypothetical protein